MPCGVASGGASTLDARDQVLGQLSKRIELAQHVRPIVRLWPACACRLSGSGRPLCDIDWSELHARKLSSGDVNSVQHRVIGVAVDAPERDLRHALGQFQGRMPQLGAPIGLRLVEAIDERTVGHPFEALQGKGRPRAIAQQPFQAGAVGAFDADRTIR